MGNEFSIGAVGSGRQWWVLQLRSEDSVGLFLSSAEKGMFRWAMCYLGFLFYFTYNVDAHAATGAHYQKPK